MDALVDLPFALPAAVAGIALTAILAGNGWLGQLPQAMGIQLAFQPAGVVITDLHRLAVCIAAYGAANYWKTLKRTGRAAMCLGASRWRPSGM